MKRAFVYECPHPGALVVYVSTFNDIRRARLCEPCTKAINDNPQDPRGIASTVTGAIVMREEKHPNPGSGV